MDSGFILVDKPAGITSHGVIARLRRITGVKRIGHAGTLDPFATGLLIVGVGREATRELGNYLKLDKRYEAGIRLGATSSTGDPEGNIQLRMTNDKYEYDRVDAVVKGFIGKQKQTPPMWSAKKLQGKKLYELARKGIEVERQPVAIEIFEIAILRYSWPELVIEVHCSSGTYIRQLAADIGEKLGCGAYCESLRRTAIGKWGIGKAVTLGELGPDNWRDFLVQHDFRNS